MVKTAQEVQIFGERATMLDFTYIASLVRICFGQVLHVLLSFLSTFTPTCFQTTKYNCMQALYYYYYYRNIIIVITVIITKRFVYKVF